MEIKTVLREMRKSAGLKQADLAKMLGYSQAKVSEYESGKHSPGFETIQRWAQACGCEVGVEWKKKAR
jgi:transcriptional regulator with XRE-family HTH domain